MNTPFCVLCGLPIDGEIGYLNVGHLDSNGFGPVYFCHRGTEACQRAKDKAEKRDDPPKDSSC